MRRAPLLVALFLAAVALRPQLVGIGPLLPSIQKDLGVSHAVAGLLGTIPVLCMGLFAPPAPYLSGRIGTRNAIAVALALIGAFGLSDDPQQAADRLAAEEAATPFGLAPV